MKAIPTERYHVRTQKAAQPVTRRTRVFALAACPAKRLPGSTWEETFREACPVPVSHVCPLCAM